jgi:hypothetical protein
LNQRDIPTLIAQHAQTYEGAGQSFFGWVLGGVGLIIATLSSVVAGLYRTQVKAYEDRIKSLEGEVLSLVEKVTKCHQEHEITRIELAKMETRLNILEGDEKGK